jgi:predicted methyltransferase
MDMSLVFHQDILRDVVHHPRRAGAFDESYLLVQVSDFCKILDRYGRMIHHINSMQTTYR